MHTVRHSFVGVCAILLAVSVAPAVGAPATQGSVLAEIRQPASVVSVDSADDLSVIAVATRDDSVLVPLGEVRLYARGAESLVIAPARLDSRIANRTVQAGDRLNITRYADVDVSPDGQWVLYTRLDLTGVVTRVVQEAGLSDVQEITYDRLLQTTSQMFAFHVPTKVTHRISNPLKSGSVIRPVFALVGGAPGLLLLGHDNSSGSPKTFRATLSSSTGTGKPITHTVNYANASVSPSGRFVSSCERVATTKGRKVTFSFRVMVHDLRTNKRSTYKFGTNCDAIEIGNDGRSFIYSNYEAAKVGASTSGWGGYSDVSLGVLGSSKVYTRQSNGIRWLGSSLLVLQDLPLIDLSPSGTVVRSQSLEQFKSEVDVTAPIAGQFVRPSVEFAGFTQCYKSDSAGAEQLVVEMEYRLVGGNFRAYVEGHGLITTTSARSFRVRAAIDSVFSSATSMQLDTPVVWVEYLPLSGHPKLVPSSNEGQALPAPPLANISALC